MRPVANCGLRFDVPSLRRLELVNPLDVPGVIKAWRRNNQEVAMRALVIGVVAVLAIAAATPVSAQVYFRGPGVTLEFGAPAYEYDYDDRRAYYDDERCRTFWRDTPWGPRRITRCR
jgi:hypothetical protein